MQGNDARASRRQRRAMEREQRRTANRGVAVASGAALALGTLAAGTPAAAATFQVTNLNDSGAGSLRDALFDANTLAGADTVTFQAGLTGTITLTSGQLYITDSVAVQGPGSAVLAVSGDNTSRVFYVGDGTNNVIDVTISGLTVTGGRADPGAGIVSWGESLVLDNVVVTGNASIAGGGVAALYDSAATTILDSIISGNSAAEGGGVFLYGTAQTLIEDTVISDNDAGGVEGGNGAGIAARRLTGSLTIERSTLSGNDAESAGGGLFVDGGQGASLTVRGSTVSGNTADAGGGVYLYGLAGAALIENSTVSGNQATGGPGGGIYLYNLYGGGSLTLRHATIAGNTASTNGGGIYLYDGTVRLENTIAGDNSAPSGNDLANGKGGAFDLLATLVEDPGTATVNDLGGAILNQDPQLGPLANNGGTTQTHLPATAGPAVNSGNNGASAATDQRGVARPVGVQVDMGAVEVNPGTIQLLVNAASVNENAGTITITVTRTGGTDGAVAVSFGTGNGTAASPADYGANAGTLNWASGDGAVKTFQVTIVNDVLDEPDETFEVTLSAPTGGATLGAITTETVTILDDDLTSAAEIPTLGDYGRLLLIGLLAAAAFLRMRQ